jgi:hypothetical protein
MRVLFQIYLCCNALFLAWFAACATPSPSLAPTRSACAAACEVRHRDGLRLYNNLKGTCACQGCSETCARSVCIDKQTPSDECLPCIQESLRGAACSEHSGLFVVGCLGDKDCAALVGCIEACDGR